MSEFRYELKAFEYASETREAASPIGTSEWPHQVRLSESTGTYPCNDLTTEHRHAYNRNAYDCARKGKGPCDRG